MFGLNAIIKIMSYMSFYTTDSGLEERNRKKKDDKKCGGVLVGFSSYFLNQLRSKFDLILFSSSIDYSIFHVNSHLKNNTQKSKNSLCTCAPRSLNLPHTHMLTLRAQRSAPCSEG